MIDIKALILELKFKAVRSSGAGGQHVNKVSSKVELFFNVEGSKALSLEEKERIYSKLKSRITKDNCIILFCDQSRSQHKNKTLVIQLFIKLIEEALKKEKERKATKVPKSVIKKRLDDKKKHSQKKTNRKPPEV